MKISAALLETIGNEADLEEMIEDGHRYFKGGTNRPFPAWRADDMSDVAKFLVTLGGYGSDPGVGDISEVDALDIAGRIMIEEFGHGVVFGFPGVELIP